MERALQPCGAFEAAVLIFINVIHFKACVDAAGAEHEQRNGRTSVCLPVWSVSWWVYC